MDTRGTMKTSWWKRPFAPSAKSKCGTRSSNKLPPDQVLELSGGAAAACIARTLAVEGPEVILMDGPLGLEPDLGPARRGK